MTDTLNIALAQLNPTVGDIAGNLAKARMARHRARDMGADLVVLSELFLSGYPPEDLVMKPSFVAACQHAVEALALETADDGPAVVIGTPWPQTQTKAYGDPRAAGSMVAKPFNAVALLDQGKIAALRYKVDLPNYSVFDEKRVFEPGPMPGPVNFRGVRLGLPICEDIWQRDVCECLSETGSEILISPNGSPFEWQKRDVRMNVAVARVVETGLPLAYVNQIGGQDELVFDGASFVLNADGSLALQMHAWREQIVVTRWRRGEAGWTCANGERAIVAEGDGSAYLGCVQGLRDYVEKNRFASVVLGLSGGVDSALVAAMAVDALGAARVRCVMLPYRYTSNESLADAADCAKALGVHYDIVPISNPVEGFLKTLEPLFAGKQPDITEENIQSRTRGSILMAISNKFGAMVLTTGNKSEMSVGYATLYGDMNGGFNPIKDLYKMEVYRLCTWRNEHVPEGGLGPSGIIIPQRILTKAPSAELRENQTDQDSLPPYEALDDILSCLVEQEMPLRDVIARGHAPEIAKKVERLLNLAEYKRRQAAPGVKISSRNFGRDRRYPITNRFQDPA